jgi:ABC-type proline/glycine betaine transport system permease subunit
LKILKKKNSHQNEELNINSLDYQSKFKNLDNTKLSGVHIKKFLNLKYLQSIRAHLQTLWYVIFIVIYVWYLFWVCYDLFVWNKTIFEVNIISYVGSISAIIFLWIGTLIWRKKKATKEEDPI